MLWMWILCAAICFALLLGKTILTVRLKTLAKLDHAQQVAADRTGDTLLSLRGERFDMVRQRLAPRALEPRPIEWPQGMHAYHFIEPAAGIDYTLYFKDTLMHVYAERVT